MAKITITLEDRREDSGKSSVAIDMTGVPTSPLGAARQTEAVRIFNKVFDLVASEKMLGAVPACRWQPGTTTLH
jgi:hypothetical protein